MPRQPIRLTISQAANLFGISQKTIRRAIADQELLYVVVRGVYKINFESLLKWSQERIKIRNKRDNAGIGQYVDKWKIKNKLFSPNPDLVKKTKDEQAADKQNEVDDQTSEDNKPELN